MKYLSICSGIEAATVAWHPLNWSPLAFAEIDAFPRAVLAHHYPHVPCHGDFTKLRDERWIADADVLVGGTPCFTAGHLVLTETGYRPIEELKPGDRVMTHLGRLQKIVRVGSKTARVGKLRAVGMAEPLTVTPDHPLLSIDWSMQNTKRGSEYARIEHCGEPEWTAAEQMPGKQWCALTAYVPQNITITSRGFTTKEAMYIAGMYLGDGHIRRFNGSNKKSLVLSLNGAKLAKLASIVEESDYTITHERTSVRATFHDTAFCDWLLENFGHYSHLKRLPSWVLSHPYRGDLLRGYLDTDGCERRNGYSISSTSKALAYGIADLLNAEGFAASITIVETPETCEIEDRTVNQRDWYQVRAFDRKLSRKSRVKHGYLCRTVQSYVETGEEEVFNIEVDEDHSYVVNGAVVHNCQAFSVAGLRNSLSDERGNLSLEFVRLADAIDDLRSNGGGGRPPSIIVWENVPGVLSVRDNAFGCFLAGLAGDITPYLPPRGKWTDAGVVAGPQRQVAWRVLDAQYFGLAQRRRRVFVVASARDGFDPAAVLLEFEGMRRDTPPRREAGKGTAHATAPCLTSSGRGVERTGDTRGQDPVVAVSVASTGDISHCLNAGGMGRLDYETETLVAHSLRAEGFDASEDGTGRGTPLVPVAVPLQEVGKRTGTSTDDPRAGIGIGEDGDPMYTLQAGAQHGVAAYAFQPRIARNGRGDMGDVVNALNAQSGETGKGDAAPCVAVAFHENQRAEITMNDTAGSLKVGGGKPGQGYPAVMQHMAVRRLTPRECEALQGFPADYTLIPWKKKPAADCPDGPRYKALGNSMAVPVMRWIGRRIDAHVRSLAPCS